MIMIRTVCKILSLGLNVYHEKSHPYNGVGIFVEYIGADHYVRLLP
ncbi:hypothetical protein SRCM101294_00803 [Bacillus amyloliquefaciens]|nr:hypothetical protein SRCM101294_00803 [Bacillus amyloliquefaciens]